jgi:hypothetical protein
MILYALFTIYNYNRLAEDIYRARISKRPTLLIYILKLKMSATFEKKKAKVVVVINLTEIL